MIFINVSFASSLYFRSRNRLSIKVNGQLKQQLSSYSKLETMSQDKRVVAGSNEQILLQRECFRSYYEEGVLDTF